MSWEQLNADAAAHHRLRAATMLQYMVAAQGDTKSWESLQGRLLKILNQREAGPQ